MKIMASGPITSWPTDGETMETGREFIFLVSKITVDGDYSHAIKRHLLLERKSMTNLDGHTKSFVSCPDLPLQPPPLLPPHANIHPCIVVLPVVIRAVHCIFSHAFESFYLLSLLPEMPFPSQFYSLNQSSSITCSTKPSLITRPTQTVLSAHSSQKCIRFPL